MSSSAAQTNNAQSEEKTRRWSSNKYLLAVLLLILLFLTALSLHQQTSMTRSLLPTFSDSAVQLSLSGLSSSSNSSDDADLIIRRSFEQSYAHILPCKKSSWKAMDSKIAIECMQKTRDYIASNPNITIPWWFQTLLRDILAGGTGVYSPWHHFFTSKPPFHFCTMGKVATTEWRRVFCKLNKEDCVDDNNSSCNKQKCTWKTTQKMPTNAPWAVFVRDPLERLLSGFLDKCYNPKARKNQGHCAPNVVFNPKDPFLDAKNRSYANLLDSLDIEGQEKAMFGAYVDVFPLKWNVHFVPQAMFCDLHRNIDKYDFVGNMGKDFYFDLDRMANKYGGQLPEVLNSTFGYMQNVMSGNHENTGKKGSAHATHTPAKVARFYTARTVRKALEYLSVDYVMLGLQVPDWAKEMLREEESSIM